MTKVNSSFCAWWMLILGKIVQWGQSWTLLPMHMQTPDNRRLSDGDNSQQFWTIPGFYDKKTMKDILHGKWRWYSSTYAQQHPEKSSAPYASFISSFQDDNFIVDIDVLSDPDYLKGQVVLHGGRIDGKCSVRVLDDVEGWPTRDQPIRILWKPISLRHPPRTTGAQFSRIIQMLPTIYRLQVQGLEIHIIRVGRSGNQLYISVVTSSSTLVTQDTPVCLTDRGCIYEFTLVKSESGT